MAAGSAQREAGRLDTTWSLLGPSLLGMVCAFLAGLLALKWLSRWLEGGRWYLFGVYCLVAASVVFALYCRGIRPEIRNISPRRKRGTNTGLRTAIGEATLGRLAFVPRLRFGLMCLAAARCGPAATPTRRTELIPFQTDCKSVPHANGMNSVLRAKPRSEGPLQGLKIRRAVPLFRQK